MKFIAGENIPLKVVERLKKEKININSISVQLDLKMMKLLKSQKERKRL